MWAMFKKKSHTFVQALKEKTKQNTASGVCSVIVKARNGGTVEKQGPEVAAAHLVPPPPPPPPPVPPCAPPTASVTFALCSSCRVF